MRLIKKIIFTIALLILADFLIGHLLQYGFNRQQSGWEHATTFAIRESKAKILILGSSRAQHSYIASIFEDEFKSSCYNAGRDGQSILYHYAIFSATLKRYKPNIVILDCETEMFAKNNYSFDRISCLLPYYHSNPEIRPILNKRSHWERYKLLSSIYPYNSMMLKIISGNLKTDTASNALRGYLPLDRSMNEPLRSVDFSLSKYQLDPFKLELLTSMMKQCQERNIQLYLICSPYYSNIKGEDLSLNKCKNLALDNQANYFDYSQDSFLLTRPNLFDDTAHVNHAGAIIFTKNICNKIKQASKL